MAWLIPIRGPLPDIANHVVQAVRICRERVHWRSAFVTILAKVLPWKFTLPEIGHRFSAGKKFIAPWIIRAIQPAARRKFPLGFGRKRFPFPDCKSFGVTKTHMDDRMALATFERAPGTLRMPPVRRFH